MNATAYPDPQDSGSLSTYARFKEVIALAAPASAAMFSYTLVGLVDTAMVGRLGAASLAGVGLSNSLVFTGGAILFGLVQSVTPLAAQNEGAGKRREAGKYLHQATWIALVGGALLSLFFSLFGSQFLHWMSPGDGVVDIGTQYLQVRALGLPFLFLIVARDSFVEALGDTKTPLKISLIGNAINALLDGIFIYGLDWGVQGAAWATVIAHGISVLVYHFHLVRRDREIPEYGLRPLATPSRPHLRKMLEVGWPMGLQFLFDVGSWLMVSIFIGWLGQNALAASQIVGRVVNVALMVSHGTTIAASSLVGRALGANRPGEALKYGWMAVGAGLIFTTFLAGFCISLPEIIVGVFTNIPEVISIAKHLLLTGMFLMFAETFSNGSYGILQGAGDTKFTMKVTFFGTWGLGVPLAYILAFWAGMGPDGVYIALGLQMTFISCAYVARLQGHAWLSHSLVDDNTGPDPEPEAAVDDLATRLVDTPERSWRWVSFQEWDDHSPDGTVRRDVLYDMSQLH